MTPAAESMKYASNQCRGKQETGPGLPTLVRQALPSSTPVITRFVISLPNFLIIANYKSNVHTSYTNNATDWDKKTVIRNKLTVRDAMGQISW